jgi:hypothetical protein
LEPSDRLTGHGEDVTDPHALFLDRSWPTRGEEGVVAGHRFGLHEKVGKRRVGGVGSGRRQNQFRI